MTTARAGIFQVAMIVAYVLIWGAWVVFGLSAVGGLVWASRRGHLGEPEEAARSIFDDSEPEGVMSDGFPGERGPADRAAPSEERERLHDDR